MAPMTDHGKCACGAKLVQCFKCAATAAAADIAKQYGPMIGGIVLTKLQEYLQKLPANQGGTKPECP